MTLPAFIFLGTFYYFDIAFLGYISLILFAIDLFPILAGRRGYQLVIAYILIALIRGYFFPISGWLNTTLTNTALLYSIFAIIPLGITFLGLPLYGVFSLFKKKEEIPIGISSFSKLSGEDIISIEKNNFLPSQTIKNEPLEFIGVKVFRSAFHHENDNAFEKLISILPQKIQMEFREGLAHYRHFISRSLIISSKSDDFLRYYEGFMGQFVPYIVLNYDDSDLFFEKDELQLDEYSNEYGELIDSDGGFPKEVLEELVDSFFSVNDFSIHNTFKTYIEETNFEYEIKFHLIREYFAVSKALSN